MAAGLGVSRRTVGRWLGQLERAGIVERRLASHGRARFLYGLRPYFRKKQVPLQMNNGHQEAFRCPLKLERAWQDETLGPRPLAGYFQSTDINELIAIFFLGELRG